MRINLKTSIEIVCCYRITLHNIFSTGQTNSTSILKRSCADGKNIFAGTDY